MKRHLHSIDRNLMSLLVCIGELVIGVLLLLNPRGFTFAVFVTLGVLLAVMGITRLVGYWRAEAAVAARSGGLVTGLVFLLAGGFCIFRWQWFVMTFPILTVVYGVVTLLNGLNKLQYAVDLWRLGQRYWYLALTGAALTLLFGAVILANPFATMALLWKFVAIAFLVEAVLDLATLLFSRR